MKVTIRGADSLQERAQRLQRQSVPHLLHAAMLEQMRLRRSEIPRATGALERSLLDGSDDTITDHQVTLTGLAYGQYVDVPQIDARKLAGKVSAELMKRSGFSGGF